MSARRLALALGTAAAIAGAAAALLFLQSLPDVAALERHRPPLPTVVLDRHGRELGAFYAERRRLVALRDVPRHLIQAVLAAEDERFFEHRGVDAGSLLRALRANWRAGGRIRQGGSTITQQLAKRVLLTPERTFARKLKDMALALRIERRLGKERILELYLNQIYFGAGAYGVAEAARTYFGKGVSDVTVSEAALLAGLPKAPSAYAPFERPEAAERRRRWVLRRMRETGALDDPALRAALAEPPRVVRPPEAPPSAAYALEEVRRALMGRFGSERVLRDGLRVETTLDLDLQRAAVASVRRGVEAVHRRREGGGEAARGEPGVEGALVALDLADGGVLALVGGYDFERSRFDRATQARRQPGSAFKPFVYAAALEAGFTQTTILYDYQVEFRHVGRPGWWRPRNYDQILRGPVPLYESLARSLNNATVRLLDDVGVKATIDLARRAGIVSPLAADLGLALGTSELTLLELTRGYASFAAGGRRLAPCLVARVLDRDGRVIAERIPLDPADPGEDPHALSPVDAYLTVHTLRGTVRRGYGTAHAARRLGHALAGKTGTTNAHRDAWFVGFSPDVAAGVWIGDDDMEPLGRGETGSRAALPVWLELMEAALAGRPVRDFAVPPGVVFAWTDPETGERQRSRRPLPWAEAFAEGRPPRESSYVPPPIPPPDDVAAPPAVPVAGVLQTP